MNPEVMRKILETQLVGSCKLVFLALAALADDENPECWPTLKQLADLTSFPCSTIEWCLDVLVASRYISRAAGGGCRIVYKIHVEALS